MLFLDILFDAKILLEFNFILLLLLFVISSMIIYFTKTISNQRLNNYSIYGIIKIIIITTLIISFLSHLISFWAYLHNTYNYTLDIFSDTKLLNNYTIDIYIWDPKINTILYNASNYLNLNVSLDFFGFTLILLAYIIGLISLLTLDSRLYWNNIRYLLTFNLFLLIVYVYASVSNILIFFMCYEFLLLPSFLIVYFVSPSRRAIQASLYFVIWTQLGSVLVLIAVSYILSITGLYNFSDLKYFNFSNTESTIIVWLLFIGFGIKVPIWPFHYWITKTHVEAPSGFSIYLSGFLVKTALYGFYKLNTCIFTDIDSSIFIAVCIMGVIDSSLKMWGQTDLKKLVAYGTIQEMNLIYLTFCWGDSYAILGGIIFTITHALLSALMFFIVDCIYRRYHTRSILEVNGILHITPNLGLAILFMLIFFSGLPGTIKFISEFYIFSGLLEFSPTICFTLMFVANVLGLIGFSKAWFNSVFGMPKKNTKYLPLDLTIKESYIILYCFFLLFIISYCFFLFF